MASTRHTVMRFYRKVLFGIVLYSPYNFTFIAFIVSISFVSVCVSFSFLFRCYIHRVINDNEYEILGAKIVKIKRE